MRQTKCKECKGAGYPNFNQCKTCKGTGEISVFTIQEFREGKVVLQSEGNKDEVIKVVNIAWPNTGLVGTSDYYGIGVDGNWYASSELSFWPNLPTQSVKIFLEEIEQEEKENKNSDNDTRGVKY